MAKQLVTPSLLRHFRKDWGSCFPSFRPYRKNELVRLCGPMLQGVFLEVRSHRTTYIPNSYVTFLGYPRRVIALDLNFSYERKPGYLGSFTVLAHEEGFREAASTLKTTSPVPLSEALSFEAIEMAYMARLSQGNGWETPQYVFNYLALLSAWCGQCDRALDYLEKVLVLPDDKFAPEVTWEESSKVEYEAEMRSYITSPDLMKEALEANIEKFELGGVSRFELEC